MNMKKRVIGMVAMGAILSGGASLILASSGSRQIEKKPSKVPPEFLLPRLVIPIDEVAQGCRIDTDIITFTRDKYIIKIEADIMYRTPKGKQKKLVKLTKQLHGFVYQNALPIILKKATINSRIKINLKDLK